MHIAEGKDDDIAIYADDTKDIDPEDYPGLEVTRFDFDPAKMYLLRRAWPSVCNSS